MGSLCMPFPSLFCRDLLQDRTSRVRLVILVYELMQISRVNFVTDEQGKVTLRNDRDDLLEIVEEMKFFGDVIETISLMTEAQLKTTICTVREVCTGTLGCIGRV